MQVLSYKPSEGKAGHQGCSSSPAVCRTPPEKSQHPTQHKSHRQGLPFGASQMQSANYVAHSSPPRAADRSQGENACFSAAIEDPNVFFFPQGALGRSSREIIEESPWGSSLHGHPCSQPEKNASWCVRPEPTDPSAVVSGEGQAEQRKK